MLKKYKITLPDGEEQYVVQSEKPYVSAECTTIITVDDEEYEYDGEHYDESDVLIEEIPMDFDEIKHQAKYFASKPFDTKYTIIFKADVLKKVIEYSIDFSYEDQIRYNIYGIHFDFQESNVEVVATNGHVLSFVAIPNIYNFIGKITIPLPVVYKILEYTSTNQDIIFCFSENLKQINFGEENNFKLIDAKFPDYKIYLDKEYSMRAKIPTKEFYDLLNNSKEEEEVLLKFSNNTLYFAENKIDCDFQGSIDIKFNIYYLRNIIKQINGSEFLLHTNSKHEQASIQEVDNASKIYIIMPMIQR